MFGSRRSIEMLFLSSLSIGVLGLFDFLVLGTSVARSLQSPRPERESDAVAPDPGTLDFGCAAPTAALRWKVRISNPSARDIEIFGFSGSCVCTSVEPRSLSLAAGKSGEITLLLNLLPRNPAEAEGKDRHFAVHITPRVAGFGPQLGFDVCGIVRAPLAVYPPSIDFGQSIVFGVPAEPRLATVRCAEPLTELDATCDASDMEITVRPAIDDRRCFTVHCAPRPACRPGRFDRTVTLRASSLKGELPPGFLRLGGEIVEDACIVPSGIVLDTNHGSSDAVADFEIRSRSGVAVDAVAVASGEIGGLQLLELPNDRRGVKRFRAMALASHWPRAVSVVRVTFGIRTRDALGPSEATLTIVIRGGKRV